MVALDKDLVLTLKRLKLEPADKNRCGRGKNLYGTSDHNIKQIQKTTGMIPLAGFFASGEIGPIGNKNFVHGYTSSLVILS